MSNMINSKIRQLLVISSCLLPIIRQLATHSFINFTALATQPIRKPQEIGRTFLIRMCKEPIAYNYAAHHIKLFFISQSWLSQPINVGNRRIFLCRTHGNFVISRNILPIIRQLNNTQPYTFRSQTYQNVQNFVFFCR